MRTRRHSRIASIDPQSLALDWRACQPERCSLKLPETLSEADWHIVGKTLGTIETSTSWWIGDWWAFGETRYGVRKAIVESEEWQGPDLQTCMNCGTVARRFKTSRRREVLTFSHHEATGSLDELDADALLDWAQETVATTGRPRSVRAMREERWKRHDPYNQVVDEEDEQTQIYLPEPSAAVGPTRSSYVITWPFPDLATAPAQAVEHEHSVHWLKPPSEGGDHEAIAMVMDVVRRITATLTISEGLRQKLAQVQPFLESALEDETSLD
jgi:hypothetical protein